MPRRLTLPSHSVSPTRRRRCLRLRRGPPFKSVSPATAGGGESPDSDVGNGVGYHSLSRPCVGKEPAWRSEAEPNVDWVSCSLLPNTLATIAECSINNPKSYLPEASLALQSQPVSQLDDFQTSFLVSALPGTL